jgi:hypothetical protein
MKNKPTLSQIKNVIEKETGIRINTKKRLRYIVDLRKMFFYIARKHTDISLSYLGAYLNRDHATALHNINSAKNLIETEPKFKNKLLKLEKLVLSSISLDNKKTTVIPQRKIHPARLRYAEKSLREILIQRR